MKVSKNVTKVLCIGLILVLLGSFCASLFNGSNGVKVNRIKFDAAHGELSGLLYMPKDASESNPKPTIIVTHGYLNSAEMQDANAIELSRRGFVVLALDQYDHGHSTIDPANYSDTSFFGLWLPFWMHSMNDAVQYMYDQPYVLKDAKGNGVIGITGHSMGGFSSAAAVCMDELQFATTGVRKVMASLTEGADFSYTAIIGFDAATADALGGGRTLGKVAAHYEEFFFNDPAVEGGTVRYKDYVSTPEGLTFLQQTSAKENTWYNTSDGGRRIVYEPKETHPWNHFSKTTTGYAVEFYMTAFKDYSSYLNDIPANKQVWQFKELSECVALVGFVFFIIGIGLLIIELPFFKLAKSGELEVQPAAKGGAKIAGILITICAILLPAIFFSPLMDGGAGSPTVMILFYAGLAAVGCGLVAFVAGLVKKSSIAAGGCCMAFAGGLLALIAKKDFYGDSGVFTAIGINSIAYWTIACAAMSMVVMSLVFICIKAKAGAKLSTYGLVFKPVTIIASICAALLTYAVSYCLLFLMDAIFKADFRIWTFAFKTFDANLAGAILRYLPTFLLFYVVSTVSITVNTNTEKAQGAKGYLLAIALNAGGAFLWTVCQYGTLFAKGVAMIPGSALSGIMIIAMVPTLTIAAIISRALYKRTGNIWMPAVLNALLMTTMTLANTMVTAKPF